MSLRFGKTEVAKVAAVLDAEHETADDAAEACLKVMEHIFESRCRFAVVAQLCGSSERLTIPPDDPEAIKLCLGWYSTEGDANSAAQSLWRSTQSGDTFRVWVLDVFHGSAAAWHSERKQHYVSVKAKRDEKQAEKDALQREDWSRRRVEAIQNFIENEKAA